MHENLFDMNHQFLHRKQMGSIRAQCIGRQHARSGTGGIQFSRTEGRPSVGEQVIVDLVRKRGQARKDFRDHMRIRTDYRPESEGLGGARHRTDARPVLDVWLCYTPLDAEQRTNRTYGYLSSRSRRFPA